MAAIIFSNWYAWLYQMDYTNYEERYYEKNYKNSYRNQKGNWVKGNLHTHNEATIDEALKNATEKSVRPLKK